MKKKAIPPLAYINGTPCVTISMNIPVLNHNYEELRQELYRLVHQAELLLFEKFGPISLNSIVDKMNDVARQIDFEDGAKSVTIFISETIQEILISLWEVPKNSVQVADYFDIRPLVTVCSTSEEYYILRLYHKEAQLYHVLDNTILEEVKDSDFPLIADFQLASRHKSNDNEKAAIRDFFDSLDKKLISTYNRTSMRYIIATCPTIYERFMHHIRFQSLYAGYIPVSAEAGMHGIVVKAWEILMMERNKERSQTIAIIKNLITNGTALTKYPDILQALREGKGDLLVVNKDVLRNDQEDNVSCKIVWDVIKHRGKVIFADKEEMEGIAPMALKVKY